MGCKFIMFLAMMIGIPTCVFVLFVWLFVCLFVRFIPQSEFTFVGVLAEAVEA